MSEMRSKPSYIFPNIGDIIGSLDNNLIATLKDEYNPNFDIKDVYKYENSTGDGVLANMSKSFELAGCPHLKMPEYDGQILVHQVRNSFFKKEADCMAFDPVDNCIYGFIIKW